VIDTAIDGAQIGGTYGMLEESQYLMILQDSVGCTVGGGTEEIHCNEIFQWLKSQASQGTLYRESAPNLQTMKPEIC